MLEEPLSSLSIPLDQGNGYFFFFFGLVLKKKKKDFLISFPKPEVISSTACPRFVYFVNV